MSSSVVPHGNGPRGRSVRYPLAAGGVPVAVVGRDEAPAIEPAHVDIVRFAADLPLTALDAVGARLLAPDCWLPRARLRGRTDP